MMPAPGTRHGPRPADDLPPPTSRQRGVRWADRPSPRPRSATPPTRCLKAPPLIVPPTAVRQSRRLGGGDGVQAPLTRHAFQLREAAVLEGDPGPGDQVFDCLG